MAMPLATRHNTVRTTTKATSRILLTRVILICIATTSFLFFHYDYYVEIIALSEVHISAVLATSFNSVCALKLAIILFIYELYAITQSLIYYMSVGPVVHKQCERSLQVTPQKSIRHPIFSYRHPSLYIAASANLIKHAKLPAIFPAWNTSVKTRKSIEQRSFSESPQQKRADYDSIQQAVIKHRTPPLSGKLSRDAFTKSNRELAMLSDSCNNHITNELLEDNASTGIVNVNFPESDVTESYVKPVFNRINISDYSTKIEQVTSSAMTSITNRRKLLAASSSGNDSTYITDANLDLERRNWQGEKNQFTRHVTKILAYDRAATSKMFFETIETKPKADNDDYNNTSIPRIDNRGDAFRTVCHHHPDVIVAPPGDLFLETKCLKLDREIDDVVDSLRAVRDFVRFKEAHGQNDDELEMSVKLLKHHSTRLQTLKDQRAQYMKQTTENVLSPERTKISVASWFLDMSEKAVYYTILVEQYDSHGILKFGWIVPRRYREFVSLHSKLKGSVDGIDKLELPSKRYFFNLEPTFLNERQSRLEQYLQSLVSNVEVCESMTFRSFLNKGSE
ncbi:8031_t:CDS:2 [Paraglomus occultum]|uniref:8031_t:CDS:1 n=1 Tax=Paraglomus occultum TaxID=144539 RepID=A0A9N8VLY1_9GLOM|nr:8031_t:CDS:2 [Paraglomus occultum]